MLRLTRTAIGLLTAQYRSVLKKCWAINVGIFALGAMAVMLPNETMAGPGRATEGELDIYEEDYLYLYYYTYYVRADGRYNYLDIKTTYANRPEYGPYFDLETFLTDLSEGRLFVAGAITNHDIATDAITYDKVASTVIQHTTTSPYGGDDYKKFTTKGYVDELLADKANLSALNNYYRKNEKSGILNGFEEGEIMNEIGDNFSKFRAVNDNFAITTFLRAI